MRGPRGLNPAKSTRRHFLAFAPGLAAAAACRAPTLPAVEAPPGPPLSLADPISRIAFGSCCDQNLPQPIWSAITDARPDVMLMLGDNVYADTEEEADLRRAWAGLADSAGYRSLRAATPVLATWDDHDYGRNDAGAEYPLREASQRAFVDFFDGPADSPRRRRAGVYDAVQVGPPGRCVHIVLLDTRFHRQHPGDDAPTVLGDAQWRWLDEELAREADLRIVVSSIQVLADEHRFETWGRFPYERARLLARLSGNTTTLLLSGDRHRAELTQAAEGPGDRPWLDLTSSSLNRPSPGDDHNRGRIGEQVVDANFGLLEIDWANARMALSVRDEHGMPRIEHRVNSVTLNADEPASG